MELNRATTKSDGQSERIWKMRKTTVAILMGMVMTVLLAGCAGGEGSEERKNSEASEEAAVVIRDSAEKETPGESVEADPDNVADSEETEETLPEESQVAETAEVSSYEEPFGEEISIDPDTQKKMNIFLSNFSEAGLYEYDQDHVDLYDILRWVERWTKMNNYQARMSLPCSSPWCSRSKCRTRGRSCGAVPSRP